MARHRGVRGKGQAKADKAAGAPAPWALVGPALRKESVDDQGMDLVTREEFDLQTVVLERTRAKLDDLERRLAELEKGGTTG